MTIVLSSKELRPQEPLPLTRFSPYFGPLLILISQMVPSFFFPNLALLSRECNWRVFELGHAKHPGVTHGHVGTGQPKRARFGEKNHESHHSGWRDSVQKHANCTGATKRARFGGKLAGSFVD
jgi:hypothetical protein